MCDSSLVHAQGPEKELIEFISMELGQKNVTLDLDVDLLNSSIIDSLSLIQLVAFIESKFGLRVEAEELTSDNFKTVSRIARFISGKQCNRHP